jgi:microcompartment protein CcmK/EutM
VVGLASALQRTASVIWITAAADAVAYHLNDWVLCRTGSSARSSRNRWSRVDMMKQQVRTVVIAFILAIPPTLVALAGWLPEAYWN